MHDVSTEALSPDGTVGGTDASTQLEVDAWNTSRIDVDTMSGSGDSPRTVTLWATDDGTTITRGSDTASLAGGASGSESLTTTETETFSESDPGASFGEVTTNNTVSSTSADEDSAVTTTGGPSTTQTGTKSPVFAALNLIIALQTVSRDVIDPPHPAGGAALVPTTITTDLNRIPAPRIKEMVKDGLALQQGRYVYITDVTPDGGFYVMILVPYVESRINTSEGSFDIKRHLPESEPVPIDLQVVRFLSGNGSFEPAQSARINFGQSPSSRR